MPRPVWRTCWRRRGGKAEGEAVICGGSWQAIVAIMGYLPWTARTAGTAPWDSALNRGSPCVLFLSHGALGRRPGAVRCAVLRFSAVVLGGEFCDLDHSAFPADGTAAMLLALVHYLLDLLGLHCGILGPGYRRNTEELAAEIEFLIPKAIGQKSGVANAHEAGRQHMQ